MENQERGHEKKVPGTEMPPENMETRLYTGIPSFAGDRASRPREGTFPRSPLIELDRGAPSFAGHTEGCRVGRA